MIKRRNSQDQRDRSNVKQYPADQIVQTYYKVDPRLKKNTELSTQPEYMLNSNYIMREIERKGYSQLDLNRDNFG